MYFARAGRLAQLVERSPHTGKATGPSPVPSIGPWCNGNMHDSGSCDSGFKSRRPDQSRHFENWEVWKPKDIMAG